MNKKHKLDTFIMKEQYEFLLSLKEKTGSSLAELIRKAIELLRKNHEL